jgi:uncharacterized repeat protein (TIGR01451 family)
VNNLPFFLLSNDANYWEEWSTKMSKHYHGVLLVLSLLLIGAVAGTQAPAQAAPSFDQPIAYEAVLINDGPSEIQLDRLEALLPPGAAYVGLAAGSQIEHEAQRVGDHLQWTGPFHLAPNSELTLRYWLAPTSPALEIPSVEVVAYAAGEAVVQATARPADLLPSVPAVTEGATSPLAVTVDKVAEPSQLSPGDEPWVAYTVTFANSTSTPAMLDRITDTLAPDFQFVGMALGSDVVDQPSDPHASTVVWQGPFLVPGDGHLQLRYWVRAVSEFGAYQNRVRAVGDGDQVGPATAEVEVETPVFSLDKSASPATVTSGQGIVYDVTIHNSGNIEGVLETITDTLPSGFTFKQMDPDSDIVAEPSGSSGTVVWTGPFTILPDSQVHLIYHVRSSGTGVKTNSVIARDASGQPVGPASAQVTVKPAYVMLPGVWRNFGQAQPPVPSLEETFDTGIPDEWTPFVNYAGLDDDFWFWTGGTGWGRYDFSPEVQGSSYRGWGLTMYLTDEASDWRDYRIESTLRTSRHAKHTLVGLWFRGTHELQTDLQGGYVTGYYLILKPDDNKVYLGKIPASNPKFQAVEWLQSATYAPGISDFEWYDLTVQVEGARIQAWLEGVKLIDWTDPDPWPKGTVGLVAYTKEGGQFDSIYVSGPQ